MPASDSSVRQITTKSTQNESTPRQCHYAHPTHAASEPGYGTTHPDNNRMEMTTNAPKRDRRTTQEKTLTTRETLITPTRQEEAQNLATQNIMNPAEALDCQVL